MVIANELNLNIDQIQSLCFYLCHDYARTSLPISIPIPLRFSELLASMSKKHLQNAYESDLIKKKDFDHNDRFLFENKTISELNKKIQTNEAFKNRVFNA